MFVDPGLAGLFLALAFGTGYWVGISKNNNE